MKLQPFKVAFRCCLILVTASAAGVCCHAATLAISPQAIDNEFNGVVTLQINGLANGDTVVVRKYADLNRNGVIDSGDLLMENFRLTDGFATTIGGVTNLNVPYDSTGTNGAITAQLNFLTGDSIRRFIGPYLFRISSPGGTFAPITNSFTITNSPHAQTITGVVRVGANPIAGATVVLLTPPPDQNLVAGTTTDAAGNYSVAVAPGTYQLIALRTGYVGTFSGSPEVTLNPGATVNANINLVVATSTISGGVVNAADATIGIPGIVLFAQSSNDSYALTSTDTNGTFTLPILPDVWQIQPQDEGLALHGYVSRQSWPQFDASAGNLTNASIAVQFGTALFYGSMRDEGGAAVLGAVIRGNDSSDQYEGGGETDLHGNYSFSVVPTTWYVSPQNDGANLSGYVIGGGTNTAISAGQAIRVNFIAARPAGTITGTVKDNSGAPVSGVSVWGSVYINNTSYNAGANTDANGHYSFGVVNGTWTIGLSCQGNDGLPNLGYDCTPNQLVSLPPTNAVANFTIYPYGTPVFGSPMSPGIGYFESQFFGAPGTNYTIQASPNLSSWSTVLITNPPDFMIYLQDNQANGKQRFYRAFIGP